MRFILSAGCLALSCLVLAPALRADDGPAEAKRAPDAEPALPESFPLKPAGEIDGSADGVAREIRALGDDDPDVRTAAVDRLFWIGEKARAAVEGALKSDDAEIVSLARQVLELLDARKSLRPLMGEERWSAQAAVGSEKEDTEAAGGWYHSPNLPVAIPASLKAPENEVSVLVDLESVAACPPRTLGRIVRIVNTTKKEAAFAACDSVIRLVLEGKDEAGNWKVLEGEPDSFCGNSYHRAFLPESRMWTVAVPVYEGSFKTKLRYRLMTSYKDDSGAILSAEFDGAVNPKLFAPGEGEKGR